MRIFFDEHQHLEKFKSKYGKKIRPIVIKEVEKFRDCGDIRKGFKLIVCEGIHHVRKVPYRCKGRFCTTNCTTIFLGQINNVLIEKKYIPKLPSIPIPNRVDFVDKQSYLKGFIGDVRTLNAMEIIHLFDNTENNITSKTLLLGFYQTVQDEKIKDLFKRGLEMTDKAVKRYMDKLNIEQLERFPMLCVVPGVVIGILMKEILRNG